MSEFPERPAGSAIKLRRTAGGVRLSWPGPRDWSARLSGVAFLLVCLPLWALGEVCSIWGFGAQLLAGNLFAILWVGAWTLAGVSGIVQGVRMTRPPRPESLTLGPETFAYDPGWAGAEIAEGPRQAAVLSTLTLAGTPPPRRAVEVFRGELRPFVLERVGGRQRLCFDRGADRVEVGVTLSDPDREWLFATLESWRTAPAADQ